MVTQESIATIQCLSVDDESLLYLGTIAIDLPRCEGSSVIHFSYAQLFETPTHFWRRSQRALCSLDYHPNRCFGVDVSDFCYKTLTEQFTLERLQECFDGNDIFAAKLNPLGEFVWGTALYDAWCTRITVAHIGRMYYASYWNTRA